VAQRTLASGNLSLRLGVAAQFQRSAAKKIMKLEYIPKGSQDSPLILLYGNNPAEIQEIFQSLEPLARGSNVMVSVHNLISVEAINHCRLIASVGTKDLGIIPSKGFSESFECVLTTEGWKELLEKLELFTLPRVDSNRVFNYLTMDGSINFVISTSKHC